MSPNGKIEIYASAQPANANSPATGTKLASIQLPAMPFFASAAGVIVKQGVWTATGIATGTAGWFRMLSSDGNKSVDGSVGQNTGEMTLNLTSIAPDQMVTVNSCTFTQPAT